MANVRNAFLDYMDCILEREKVTSLKRRYNTPNLQISFRINWIVMLTVTASILFCQFAESDAKGQASSSHGGKHYNQHCLNQHSNLRRSMTSANHTLQSIVDDPAIASQDILSRLEAAAILRDNLVTALGRMLLLCLDDNARVPFELIHDAIRNRRVAVYELLPVLPALRNKLPKQQLYNLLQILERVDNRFVSEYTSLCINIFDDINAVIEQAPLSDMLWNIDPETIRSISLNKRSPLSLTKDVDSLLRAARNDVRMLNLRVVAAILMNYPAFDLTDPEIHDAINFVAERMRERSRAEDPLLWNIELSLENAMDFLRTVLERLEVDELSSKATREAISLLLQNLGAEPYPLAPTWKDKPKILSMITNNYYPINVTAVAKYLANHLDDSHFRDLDIGFYETGDQALLQTLSRLRRKVNLRHLNKPLSLLTSFVSQKLAYDSNYAYTAPVSQYEMNNYLDTFDTPCLQQNVSDAMRMLRSHLSDDLPWTYAFGDKRASDDPRELTLLALTHLRSIPISKPQAIVIDNFVYKSRAGDLTGRRSPLYDSGVIFQRDDSTDVEVDLFSLLMRIPNAFKSEKFTPMLNFLSKPNILDILGYEFNKFEYETPRSLLLALLKKALTLASVKSDEPLSKALQNARNYLEEPLLINLYTSEELQLLLEQLPGIENDPRYLPLKLFFKKKRLFTFLSRSFSLAGVHTPKDRLLLILRTIGLKIEEASAIFSEALSFALNNIDGPPLKIRTFDRIDFIYLVQQLFNNKSLQNEILKSSVYMNVGDWNISISGTPENVLARVLSYPVKYIASDGHLAGLVKRAVSILEEENQIDIEILKKRTLEAMLEYLPNNTYVKPVILLLKKANLMTLVPRLNLSILEKASPRDALIMLLRYLTESNVIRTEKLLLRRVRATLSSLDGNKPPQTPIYAYLIQSLQDPSNVVYKPLLREVNELRNVTVLSDERQVWLQSYLEDIVAKNKTKKLVEAALMALKEIGYDEYTDEETRVSKARINEALSFLPIDSFAKPLRKLLTSEWAYSILPEEVIHSSSLEKEELLIAILYHAKRRTDIADNPALMKIISNVETKLNGWKTKVEMLKSAVVAAKAAIYDPVRDLLTASGLNKLRIIVPFEKSAKLSLLVLLRHLLKHPVIQNNTKVFELLSAVRQDVLDFGVDGDLLTVLDDVGIPYTSELAPVRLFLHNQGRFNDKFARIVFPIADPAERYRILLGILWQQSQINNDTRLYDALLILRNIEPVATESPGTSISDLEDVVNSIPHQVKPQFKLIEQLFNIDFLSRFTHDNEIVESKKPLTLLLSKMATLPEVSRNHTAARELTKLQSEVEKLLNRSIFTGYQLRPLLVELKHVQQTNIDYLNSIIDPEVLNYLNPEEFSDISDDNTEILSTILDYLLYEETMYVDYNMQKHLQSLKRALALTMGPSKTSSKRHLSKKDWEKMLVLIPRNRDFAPIKIFLQSEEIYKYIPKDTNWKIFSTPVKKLLHLLSLIESSDIENKNIYKSANNLRENLDKRFNFVSERDVKSMHHVLTSLKLKYDLAPLKIFLNHDNLIKYLPPDFKYTKYGTSINGLAAVLDIFLQSPSLKQRKVLYQTMIFVRESIREKVDSARRSSRRIFHKRPSAEDLEFISSIALPKISEFLKPEKLLNLLPQSFSLDNRPTFKMKALHLLQQLLQLNITDVHSELEKLAREVETYPDVPNITQDDLAPLLNILPIEGIPHIELIKKYLRPLTLIKLLPGNFIIKQTDDAKSALHNVLSLLSATLGSAKNDKLKIALDALTSESAKINSNVIPEVALVNSDDIKSIIEEIPFGQYKQIESLKTKMTVMNVVSSLPMNFQLTNYNTKKLRVLAVLNELSKNKEFKPWLHSVNFAKRIVSKMPNMPVVNDTEIERLILPLPLNSFYVKEIITNCKLATLMPYLPIHFNLASLESRKMKIAKILHYCKMANPTNMSTKQALTNAETSLKSLPDFDVTSEHIEVLIRSIPCTRFTMIKPLLRFLSTTNIVSLLPWDLDVYRTSRTFKLRILDLLAALRNIKELQNGEMFTALDYLEINTKSLPEKVNVPQGRITVLNTAQDMSFAPCVTFRDFVSKTDNLIQILPPNYRFQTNPETVHNEWALIMYMSSLFLRDVKMDGIMKNAFKVCVDNRRRYDKGLLRYHIYTGLMTLPYVQFVALRLYTLIHNNTLTAPIENVYRGGFLQGTIYTMIRVMMREFIRRPELIGSKSVIDDMEVFLHDYVMLKIKENKTFHEEPTPYDIDLAINEIPSDRKYDDLKVLLRCQKIETPVVRKNLSADDTPKQLLLELLKVAESGDIDDKVRKSIEILKPDVAHGIREEEVEYVLKRLRDYRYHASKLQTIRKYLVQVGLQSVLMNDTKSDFHTAYPTYKQRLYMLNERLLQGVPGQPNDGEFQTELKYLNRTLHNETKIDHIMSRTIDDINMESLFLALPKTKDERLIRGIIKFFSIPDLLRRLNLPKDPFEYVTKGRLLEVIMDLGQELESVQQDPVQQEALEYFRDKIKTTGTGAQPIELKKDVFDSNVDVDTYGLMRAIDYTKVTEINAVNVATFLDHKYDRLVYGVGFNHLAYATRGAYLKALFEHLVNISQVPDDTKTEIKMMMPAVTLDGMGEEGVDLNVDVVHEVSTLHPKMSEAETPVARFGTEIVSRTFQDKDSLKAAIYNMLETISSSEEENPTDQKNIYNDKTRVVSGSILQHSFDVARRRWNSTEDARNLNSSRLEETKRPSSELSTEVPIANDAKTKRKKNDRSSLLDDIFEIPIKHNKTIKKGGTKSKNDSSRRSNNLDYLSDESADSSIKSQKRIVNSLPSQNSLSEELPEKSRNRKHHESSQKSFLQPDTSIDIEYDDVDRNASIIRILRDMLLRDEENLSLIKELIEKETSTGEKRRTVKKDLSRHARRERRDEKEKEKHERQKMAISNVDGRSDTCRAGASDARHLRPTFSR